MTVGTPKRCPKCFSTSGNDWSQCGGSCPMAMSPHHRACGAQGSLFSEDRTCDQPHYAVIVEADKDVEIYQRGDVDCPSCLRRMVEKHEAIAEIFRTRLAAVVPPVDATALSDLPRALCHECSEMVDVVGYKLAPHHGEMGAGCPQNGAKAQIYLHPKVAARIAELETTLAFGVGDAR